MFTSRVRHLLVAITTLSALATSGHAAERPNILFIFSDDHAVNAISAYGGRLQNVAPTPNIDKIDNLEIRLLTAHEH